MRGTDDDPIHTRWARLRFAIIGTLLAAPPPRAALHRELAQLAERTWRHPTTGEPVRFAVSTLERWYYRARGAARDPVGALRPRVRSDLGRPRARRPALCEALRAQHRAHPSWSYQLHVDNVTVTATEDPALGPVPSYTSVRRYLKAQGLVRQARRRAPGTPGEEQAVARRAELEVRSFEAEYVHGLWPLDFHHGSRPVVTRAGAWVTPLLLGVLDDRSRVACHLQWYLDETAETLVHGRCQAIQKRALPRALLTDNGSAMVAAETVAGLEALGIVHATTLPYSPYQNAKQEVFWAQVEGRLLAMLEGVGDLTLALLNEATQAWGELEYNQKIHAELGVPPLRRYLDGPDVGRESPRSEALRQAFRLTVGRTQRRSDGTVSIAGRRFEVPARYRHLARLCVRYARWDLRAVDLVDPRSQTILCALSPLDKTRNADGQRRRLDPTPGAAAAVPPAPGMAPLLRRLMADYAATGLPPAYLPRPHDDEEEESPR